MLIRAAEPSDAEAACDVLRRSIAELCEADHRNDEIFLANWLANKTPENFRSWLTSSHVYVAEEAGRLLGVAAVSEMGNVLLNYVAPEARFRGVSKTLLGACEDKARRLACAFISLESTKTAERFYLAQGYQAQIDLPARVLRKALM